MRGEQSRTRGGGGGGWDRNCGPLNKCLPGKDSIIVVKGIDDKNH